jgi:type IX secretion system PorP/SprF family membrane protein
MNGQFYNPAYAGSREVLSVNLLARQQWSGIEGAPQTLNFGLHTPLKKLNLATGFVAFTEKIGVSQLSGVGFNYVYRIRFNNGKRNFALGLKTGITSFYANLSNVKLVEKNDPEFNGIILSQVKFDAAFGMYYYAPHFYFSYSIPLLPGFGYNAYQENDSINIRFLNTYATIGGIIDVGNGIKLHPSLFFKANKNDGQIDLNFAIIVLDALSMGVSIRSADALVFLVDYQISSRLRIGYAHDFTTSALQHVTTGSNEISLRYEFVNKYNVYSTRFF